MDVKTTTGLVLREGWDRGVWDHEPDRWDWVDRETGYPCLVLRHFEYGNLCGYAAVPRSHALHGVRFDDERHPMAYRYDELYIDYGITYTDRCQEMPDGPVSMLLHPDMELSPKHLICHAPEPGQPDDVWWVGFACSSYMDLQPGMMAKTKAVGGGPTLANFVEYGAKYRHCGYVISQVGKLAAGLARFAL